MLPEFELFARELVRRDPAALEIFRLPQPAPRRPGPAHAGLLARMAQWLEGLGSAPLDHGARR